MSQKRKAKVQSIADLATQAAELNAGQMALFRGQNTDQPLKPKIARNSTLSASEVENVERQMLERFKKESVPLLQGVQPKSDW